jgi:hypothetical protein
MNLTSVAKKNCKKCRNLFFPILTTQNEAKKIKSHSLVFIETIEKNKTQILMHYTHSLDVGEGWKVRESICTHLFAMLHNPISDGRRNFSSFLYLIENIVYFSKGKRKHEKGISKSYFVPLFYLS